MPEFVHPFTGMTPDRKMTLAELIRALRLNLAAEEEAVHLYMAHADATDNELAAAVLRDIADEERVHAGEFQRLLNILAPEEARFLAEGSAEVDEIAAELAGGATEAAEAAPAAPEDDRKPTVGDMTGSE